MKQSITKEQLKELTDNELENFYLALVDKHGFHREISCNCSPCITHPLWTPNIGQMIEFLQHDIEEFSGTWYIKLRDGTEFYGDLCDMLWEAVKYKLRLELRNIIDL